MSVKVIALLHCHADAEETFEQELKRLVEASVNEEGCIQYELYQYKQQSCHYMMIEEWRDDAAFQHHQDTPHYKHFVRVSPVLLQQPVEIKVLTRLA